jgi:hypothetical protein
LAGRWNPGGVSRQHWPENTAGWIVGASSSLVTSIYKFKESFRVRWLWGRDAVPRNLKELDHYASPWSHEQRLSVVGRMATLSTLSAAHDTIVPMIQAIMCRLWDAADWIRERVLRDAFEDGLKSSCYYLDIAYRMATTGRVFRIT